MEKKKFSWRSNADADHIQLRKMQGMKQFSQTNIVYLDETWLNSYTMEKCWTDTSETVTEIQPPTGKRDRLILLHAGIKDGFVANAEMVFQAKNEGDYHKH